jgi:NAD(P)-dependent dehydrogenase (short-subunit alcohol dehydrogenase family)
MPPTALVTGATDGMGLQAARMLGRDGWHVIVHGRRPERVEAAVEWLRGSSSAGSFKPVVADLAQLDQVEALAAPLRAAPDRAVDVLVNNAGVFTPTREATVRRESADGFELMWAVNYLAPFLLTMRLEPVLARSPHPGVLNVGSGAHVRGEIHWSDLHLTEGWDRMAAYAQAKLALAMFTRELAGRWSQARIGTLCVNPGYTGTKMVRDGLGGEAQPVSQGAAHIAAPLLEGDRSQWVGQYVDQGTVSPAHPLVDDADARRRLWDLTVAQLDARSPL